MMLIGLAGPPGAGKRTVADYLHARHTFVRLALDIPIGGPDDIRLLQHAYNVDAVVQIHSDAEADYIRGAGGEVWLIQRPGHLTRDGDAYRGILPRAEDLGILNDGTLDDLQEFVDALICAMRAAAQP